MASAVSISSDTFSPSQGPNVKSYMLMLRVTVTKASVTTNGTSSTEITNGDNDGKSIFLFIYYILLILQVALKFSGISACFNTYHIY